MTFWCRNSDPDDGYGCHTEALFPDAADRPAFGAGHQHGVHEPLPAPALAGKNGGLDRPGLPADDSDYDYLLRARPDLWPALLPRFTAALVAFSVNYACYFSEIYRGGIQSIPVGQQEAGLVLGMTGSCALLLLVSVLSSVAAVTP